MASIKQRGKNSYQIAVYCRRDMNGKKVMETVTYHPDESLTPKKKKLAVEDFAREFEKKVRNEDIMDGRKITLQEYTLRWKEEWAEIRLHPHTVEGYLHELDNKILPALGHLKLTDLKPSVVNSFFVSLGKDGARKDGKPGGYSKASIKKTFDVLSSVLHTAVDLEVLDRNPCDRVRLHAEDPADRIKFFTPEQAGRFLDYLERPYTIHTKGHGRVDDTGESYTVGCYESVRSMAEQQRILFNLAIFGGLRKGELLALQWNDIDFDNGEVNVTKSITLVGGKPVCKAPKTRNSIRVVSLPCFLIDRLRRLQGDRRTQIQIMGDRWKGDKDWIFVQEDGRLMNYCTPNHLMQDVLERYNYGRPQKDQLPRIPFHGLRHTSATLLIASHQDVKTVQTRLGHAEASTTLNIYAHALKESDRCASDALERILPRHT